MFDSLLYLQVVSTYLCFICCAQIRFWASSFPYSFSKKSLNTRKAMAGSVVVPDFEIMLMETRLPLQIVNNSVKDAELMVLPAK